METKLAASLDNMKALLLSRMTAHEEKLEKVTAANSPPADIIELRSEYLKFKGFVLEVLSSFSTQIELLSQGHDRHETAMRKKVLLVHGVPEVKQERLHDVVTAVLTSQMKLSEVGGSDIHVCHRLGYSNRSPRPILVRFFKTEHRHLVWDNKKSLKGSGITISEFLTQMRHRAFTAARKYFGITNCWSVEGKIVIIAPDKSRHKIEYMSQLEELIAKFPRCPSDGDDPVSVAGPGLATGACNDSLPKTLRRTRNTRRN
ncbi:uncharacterized protein LOC111359218 [Spodoptera litura]|uniref:Uncharacterized protein LOC111359218 n=1 Tax=Spodoptera litura TaxID=69820 RepID=A0A9J7EGT0_SPOLT|nr:uncharacterized protein LOC111359218 [Spodoptera litura]